MFQVWRGAFIDATPMWHDRGDGSSRPLGAVLSLTKPVYTLSKLTNLKEAWKTDTVGAGFKSKGYTLDPNGLPSFHYQINGMNVTDVIRVSNSAQGLTREIMIQNPSNDVYAKIAEDKSIQEISKGRFVIGDKRYYLQINSSDSKPLLRESNGYTELLVPVSSKISYSIIY
jgi:hypothetical protein